MRACKGRSEKRARAFPSDSRRIISISSLKKFSPSIHVSVTISYTSVYLPGVLMSGVAFEPHVVHRANVDLRLKFVLYLLYIFDSLSRGKRGTSKCQSVSARPEQFLLFSYQFVVFPLAPNKISARSTAPSSTPPAPCSRRLPSEFAIWPPMTSAPL